MIETRKFIKRILLPGVVLVILLVAAYLMFFRATLDISKGENSWTCSGENLQPKKARICGEKVVVVEVIRNMHAKRSWPKDTCFVTAFSIPDGKKMYKIKMMDDEILVQVYGIWAWGEKVVVGGLYQKKGGGYSMQSSTIIDNKGDVSKISNKFSIHAIDSKNNRLICLQTIPLHGVEDVIGRPRIRKFWQYDLLTGEEIPLDDMEVTRGAFVFNSKGEVYTLGPCSPNLDEAETMKKMYSIKKYSSLFGKQLWSVEFSVDQNYNPLRPQVENGLVWYAFSDNREITESGMRRVYYSGGPFNAETGEKVITSKKGYDPDILGETDIDGKHYVLKIVGDNKVEVSWTKDKD